jgi:hypothetical protein
MARIHEIDYALVPEHLREGLRRYVETGGGVGNFLTSMIENDLIEAVLKADENSLAGIRDLCIWLYNEAPQQCWGSKQKRLDWQKAGGLQGKSTEEK